MDTDHPIRCKACRGPSDTTCWNQRAIVRCPCLTPFSRDRYVASRRVAPGHRRGFASPLSRDHSPLRESGYVLVATGYASMARSNIMLKETVDTYLAVRRAAGFKLTSDAFYLYHFARFATAQGDTHVTSQTAITWAGQARSKSQRATRLKNVIRFDSFSYADD